MRVCRGNSAEGGRAVVCKGSSGKGRRAAAGGRGAEAVVVVSDHGAGEGSALLATLAVLTHSVCSLRCAHSA